MLTLSKIELLIQEERARRANKRFADWLYKARTAEFINSRFFYNAATGKRSQRLRFKSYKEGECIVTDPCKVAEHAARYFEEVFEYDIADISFLSELPYDRKNMKQSFPQFKVEEVKDSLKWLRYGKAPGVDRVCNEMLKLSSTKKRDYSHEFAEVLTTLFNRIIQTGYFPNMWKQCIIVPAYKKGCPMTISNFRPICLLSGLSKVFTRLLNQRVSDAAEKARVFTNTQGGGRKMRDIREKLSIIREIGRAHV